MPALSFDYAVVRVVPRVERGEFVNVGVILYCRGQDYLVARIEPGPARLVALWPPLVDSLDELSASLTAMERVAAGDAAAGPIAALPQAERFHWLVAPRSAMTQISPVHSGLCDEPDAALEQLLARTVRVAPAPAPR